MKQTYKNIVVLSMLLLILGMMACEYDAPVSVYNQNMDKPASPVITQVDPIQAGPGVNYLTLIGENFSADSGGNLVYVNGVKSEIVDFSTTSIQIRRPAVVGDSTRIKLVTLNGLGVGEHSPYAIDEVVSSYGGFIAGEQFGTVVVGDDELMYVFHRTLKHIYRIMPDGSNTNIGQSDRAVKQACFAPDGQLVFLLNRKNINKYDPETGVEIEWVEVSKNVNCGDFDDSGYLYAGGKKSDLFIIAPDLTVGKADLYANDEIIAIHVFDNSLYMAVKLKSPAEGEPETGIWKHAITGAGQIGARELVLDWTQSGEFAESALKDFALSESGKIVVASDHENPLLIVDGDQQDVLYKGIIPTRAEKIMWGTGTAFYMVLSGDAYDLLKIDLGETGL